MNTDKLRGLFADYLTNRGIGDMIVCDSCITINQDVQLKYERVDKHRILFLTQKDIKNLMRFCEKHNIAVWFGADKLCIGFNYKGCMRLSAYDSVLPGKSSCDQPADRNNSVSPEISGLRSYEDRMRELDHHLDVHGGVD